MTFTFTARSACFWRSISSPTCRRRSVLFSPSWPLPQVSRSARSARLGDLIGRKYTFLITMTLMGFGTFFIGVLPGYARWGIVAPIVLIALRLVQGLALGGEYGGAAIYVAEHAPANRRGYYTSWIQTTATLGLFMALLI